MCFMGILLLPNKKHKIKVNLTFTEYISFIHVCIILIHFNI